MWSNLTAIANPKLHISALQQHFTGKGQFTSKDVEVFYRGFEPEVKYNTVSWRVYALVHSGILARTGKGKFMLGTGRIFIPEVPATIKSLYNTIHRQFPYIQVCVWSTDILNEFMLHQPGRHYLLVEVDKETMQSVFHFLKETRKNIFLDPTLEVLSLYASKEQNAVIIKSLVSEAPIQFEQDIFTVTLEKVIVDIFCDEILFAAQQGTEMRTIFNHAFENYTINENKMFRYADRRGKKEALLNYLYQIPNFRQQEPKTANY